MHCFNPNEIINLKLSEYGNHLSHFWNCSTDHDVGFSARKVSVLFGFLNLFLLFRGFKSRCYVTKQKTEASQLPVSRDHLQAVERPVSFVAQLLQGASYNAHQADQEEHRTLHHGLRIRSAAGFVPHGEPVGFV